MIIARLAWQSLRNRWVTVLLTILAISVSVVLLLGVEKVRNGARESFAGTVSGADILVGARAGGMQLLLYSIFHIGNATNNVTWRSYEDIVSRPEVDWAIPLSLGDSHRGFRVIGTTQDYFTHFHYRGGQSLKFADGKPFDDLFDVVLGADVASQLGYGIGDKIIIAHGIGSLQLVAWVRMWAQSPLSPSDYAARLKTARPRRVMRLRDFVAIWFSVIWRFISLAFSSGPMTNLRRPIWASTRARSL
jgi:hypothetical protein